ncbi:MAG: HDOD domain-containing protein [Deltaproteobacteria bacterium]|nr:HDOD domain-containing protein [Deltaproteobacteria bacterium]
MLIAIEEIEAGMRTAKSVMNQRGQILLPKDTELNDKLIQGLRSWSIRFVDVQQSEDGDVTDLTDEQLLMLEDSLVRTYSQSETNDENPLFRLLRELYRDYLETDHNALSAEANVVSNEPLPAEKWMTVPHLIQNAKFQVTIPEIRHRLSEEMNRPEISVTRIGEWLSRDPVLSAMIIRMSNTVWYGVSHRANTVSRAVSVIGYEDVKKFVQDTAVASRFSESDDIAATPYSFWIHSYATSVFTQIIGSHLKYPDLEQLTQLGLLHDMGKLLLYMQVPQLYSDICRFAWQSKTPTLKLERRYLGFYHNMLTMELLKHWNFTKASQDTVYFHHTPENATHKKEAYTLHLADALANAMGFSVQKHCVHPAIAPNILAELQLKEKFLAGIIAEAQQQIVTVMRELGIQ